LVDHRLHFEKEKTAWRSLCGVADSLCHKLVLLTAAADLQPPRQQERLFALQSDTIRSVISAHIRHIAFICMRLGRQAGKAGDRTVRKIAQRLAAGGDQLRVSRVGLHRREEKLNCPLLADQSPAGCVAGPRPDEQHATRRALA
jgi:hypothetical protein